MAPPSTDRYGGAAVNAQERNVISDIGNYRCPSCPAVCRIRKGVLIHSTRVHNKRLLTAGIQEVRQTAASSQPALPSAAALEPTLDKAPSSQPPPVGEEDEPTA